MMHELFNPLNGHFWLAAGLVLAILEMFLPGFILLSLGLGALLPAVMAYLGVSSLGLLLGAYAGFSVLTLFSVRTILGRKVFGTMHNQDTNIMGMVGSLGIVTTRVGDIHRPGYVKIKGEDWRAITTDGAIEEGACVMVESITGATLMVSPQETSQSSQSN